MITVLIIIALISLMVPVYVYVGYPLFLIVLDRLFVGKTVDRAEITPDVTMVVSCYNESDIIEQKISNCLGLDYPADRIEFLFVSDGSDDGTDEIIKRYSNEKIRLIRQEGRLGKTMGLNLAMTEASGEIVVFSDANAMYKEDAIRMLVRNFNDAGVGYVVGAAIYQDETATNAGASEDIYWKYEIFIKKIESKLHSVVGGDGAIYAIRRALYKPLEQVDINDFVNPLQIIASGYRGIFDADAICYEQTAGDFDKEGNRKQRIVNRSFDGLMRNSSVLNPFRFGFYSLELISHKLLRWLIPFFLIISAASIIILASLDVELFQWLLLLGISFVWSILVGRILKGWQAAPSILLIPYYFYLVNVSSLRGILQSLQGTVQVTWSTPRDTGSSGDGASIVSWMAYIAIWAVSIMLFMSTLQDLMIR